MKNLLITQCLQTDFVKSLAHDESLPNTLHVGHHESRRLLGLNPALGPIRNFMDWAQRTPDDRLGIIHIRDWHDPDDEHQQSHLQLFGSHCLRNTAGAEFVFDLDRNRCTIINSTTLNDFAGTDLEYALGTYVDEPIHVGLIGVWTEAKILFLAYELATRYPHLKLAVCSALTASSSRAQHFLALQQLDRIVGVKVLDSIGEFSQFLIGQSPPLSAAALRDVPISMDAEVAFEAEDRQLINYLFRDCTHLQLKLLDGGFSGNMVAGARGLDVHGHEMAPHVIKIGPRHLMARERTAFEQIEAVLGNNAPAIADYADLQQRGAIKYRYAAIGEARTKSFQNAYQTGAGKTDIHRYLDSVLGQQLGRLYRAARLEHADLTHYYQFDAKWAQSIEQRVRDLLGSCPDTETMTIEGMTTCNIFHFYRHHLPDLPPLVGDFPFSFVHGDLNGANIIIDGNDNVWLIDFFHTHRGHALKDFAKLENDILFIYTHIEDHAAFERACRFTDFLLAQHDISAPLLEAPAWLQDRALEMAYETIMHLRTLLCASIPEMGAHADRQWLLAQLRYAVHTLGFEECNIWQKKWALYAAGQLVQRWLSDSHPRKP